MLATRPLILRAHFTYRDCGDPSCVGCVECPEEFRCTCGKCAVCLEDYSEIKAQCVKCGCDIDLDKNGNVSSETVTADGADAICKTHLSFWAVHRSERARDEAGRFVGGAA